jgi:hypothetical protein
MGNQTVNEGVVAFLDALGTKGISTRTDPEEYIKSWETFLTDWEQYKKQALENSSSCNVDYDIRAFSDTIIITIKLNKKDNSTLVIESDKLLLHCSKLIAPMVINGIFKGIYLRGVMSIGKFYQTQNSIIGPAVDEAAEWYMNTEWIGVSAAPTAHFILEKLEEIGGEAAEMTKNLFIKYDVPTKINSTEKSWAVNWPKLYKNFPR